MDTSGVVEHWHENRLGVKVGPTYWPDLSPFEQGYTTEVIKAAMRAREECDGCPGENPEDPDGPACCRLEGGFSDLAPETLAAIRKDCVAMVDPPHVFRNGADAGARCWRSRQEGWAFYTGGPSLRRLFPPLTVSLNNAGKVVFGE